MATAYAHIERNKRWSLFLAALFPVSFALFIYISVRIFHFLWSIFIYFGHNNVFTYSSLWKSSLSAAHETCLWLIPLGFGLAAFWAWQAYQQGDLMLLESLPRVRALQRFEAEDAYELLENLCIASGDYLPSLYVLKDNSMNAFSLGMTPMRGAIVLSSGLLQKLDRVQLEAVLAHELAHIRNYDTRLMVIIITCLAFFTFCGECLFFFPDMSDYSAESEVRTTMFRCHPSVLVFRSVFMYIGASLLFYGYFFAPLIRCALSRSQELTADAQAVLLTRYPKGLSRALWRISEDSRIEMLDEHPLVGAMCIAPPVIKKGFFIWLSGLNSTHPPLGDRLCAINDMDGLFMDKK